MAKKLILSAIVVFLAVFLLYPTTKSRPGGCDAGIYGNCVVTGEVLDSFGGGIKYLKDAILTGALVHSSDALKDTYDIGNLDSDSSFHPKRAIATSAIVSIIVSLVFYRVLRSRKSK